MGGSSLDDGSSSMPIFRIASLFIWVYFGISPGIGIIFFLGKIEISFPRCGSTSEQRITDITDCFFFVGLEARVYSHRSRYFFFSFDLLRVMPKDLLLATVL